MSSGKVHHPIFARMYIRMAAAAEKAGAAEHRDEMLAGLTGRVIEAGAGSGINFTHYPSTVTQVVAVEPEAYLRGLAEKTARQAPVPITVVDGTAEHLPAGDASFDACVASLMLCSVADQTAALAELHRVIRPGGELRFYEHVRADSPRRARLQDRVQPAWTFFGGGCHPNRETEAAITGAGFEVEDCRRFLFQPDWFSGPSAPVILGCARRPAETNPVGS